MTPLELRKTQYENIIDEVLFISRASEGSVSESWLMNQPIFIRKKYLKIFKDEVDKREKSLNKNTNKPRSSNQK